MAKTYDPGRLAGWRLVGPGLYRVESFRQPGMHYLVDIRNFLCNCPSFAKSHGAGCKRLRELLAELRQRRADAPRFVADPPCEDPFAEEPQPLTAQEYTLLIERIEAEVQTMKERTLFTQEDVRSVLNRIVAHVFQESRS